MAQSTVKKKTVTNQVTPLISDPSTEDMSHQTGTPPTEVDEVETIIRRIPNAWWQAHALANHHSGGTAEDFKSMLIQDLAQYAIISALLLTVTIPLLLTKQGDFVDDMLNSWQANVFVYGALVSTTFHFFAIASSVNLIVFTNLVPAKLIYHYQADLVCLPIYQIGVPPFIHFWVGVVALVPTLSAGACALNGQAALGFAVLGILTSALAMSVWQVINAAALNIRFMKKMATKEIAANQRL